MLYPAPTTTIDPSVARGTLLESRPETATTPPMVVIGFPNTNYQMHLVPVSAVTAAPGKRILGTIRVEARRVDIVHTGGAYVEPLYGHPRRVQGRVLSGDDHTRTLIIDAAIPIHCRLTDPRQAPSQFPVGELVSFDAMDGATFTATH